MKVSGLQMNCGNKHDDDDDHIILSPKNKSYQLTTN